MQLSSDHNPGCSAEHTFHIANVAPGIRTPNTKTIPLRSETQRDGQPYTFEEIYDEMVPDDEGPWQQVVDYWESEMLDYPEELY